MKKTAKAAVLGLSLAAAGVAGVATAWASPVSKPAVTVPAAVPAAAVTTANTQVTTPAAPEATEAKTEPAGEPAGAAAETDGPGGWSDPAGANVDTQQQGEH